MVFLDPPSRRVQVVSCLPAAPDPPGLRILPADVSRMIEVQQQSFAPIKKSQAKKIIPDKRQLRNQSHIPKKRRPRPANLPLRRNNPPPQRAVPVHALKIVLQVAIPMTK